MNCDTLIMPKSYYGTVKCKAGLIDIFFLVWGERGSAKKITFIEGGHGKKLLTEGGGVHAIF